MALFPAECPNCGYFYISNALSIQGVEHLTIANAKESCHRCGSLADIISGEFSVLGDKIKVLSASPENVAKLARMQALLNCGADKLSSPSEIVSEIENISPEVATVLRDTAQKRSRMFALVCACPMCLVPGSDGISLYSDPSWRKTQWDKFYTAAPRPRTPSEKRYSDRKLRSRN